MSLKKLIPCIYLYRGNAVVSLTDHTVIALNPVELAIHYCESYADGLLIFDQSADEEEHYHALDVIKEICFKVETPVIGAGHVERMEDVKKLLYAGCKKAVLNYSKESNISLTEEVSLKFGREKIAACVDDVSEITDNEELLAAHVDEIILIAPGGISEALEQCTLPLLVSVSSISLDKIIEILSVPAVTGITGNGVNENVKELITIKDLCKENGIEVHAYMPAVSWEELQKNTDGLLPVVVQDYRTAEVLMVAYMDETAYLTTLKTGKMTYFSRSRRELWIKGDTSGHFQYWKSLTADCDKDTILARVLQVGAACHTGNPSCFFQEIVRKEGGIDANPFTVFEKVLSVIKDRKINPREGSYTNYLFDKGVDKILKKMGEEATEIVIAAKNPNPNEIKYEIADFLYHMMVLMVEKGVSWEEITEELARR